MQTAMAVSGAAFASATGSYHGPANLILALTNARLGSWFANPRVLSADLSQWWQARPPRIRRMSYLLREIFGWYPIDCPLIFVTDGGHYENLGLVELFRHGCTEIYCFDASSDTDAFAASIARSITLAEAELGVVVDLNCPEEADPRACNGRFSTANGAGGTARSSSGTRADQDLQGRLADTPIITATFRYPAATIGDISQTGILVIGRATMDEQTPWQVKRHAAAHPLFPHDVTGDQWFDGRKFNAYSDLGHHVGQRAAKEMERMRLHSPTGFRPIA